MKKNIIKVLFSLIMLLCILSACSEDKNDTNTNPTQSSVASCEGCHTNYDHLKKVADPYVDKGGGGCGGDVPHVEPYDAVYMGGAGFQEFKKSKHYEIGCVGCHKGVDKTDDKKKAHSGDFLAKPSILAGELCGGCHKEETKGHATNMHNGFGQMKKVTQRYGLAGAHEFNKLPQNIQDAYKGNCATCHASCGECHISRPHAAGGGLAQGHAFSKKPDMISVCVKCHSSRGGHAFLGVAPGTKPDVHQQKGMTCMSCHSKEEIHGDGVKYESRYLVAQLPKCENCHSGLANKNLYHSVHYTSFNCNVCHSQPYNSCGSCHVGGEGVRITSYQDFKIALNPIPDIKKGYKFTTVRRNPAAPDNWQKYGLDNYPNFAAHPTYNYTSPHNILRWTELTKVEDGKSCYSNCHIRSENGKLINKKYYLFEENLLDWEIPTTKKITVDGQLPSSWFK